MSHILANKISLSYPIFGADTQSLKRDVLNITTGGRLKLNSGAITQVNALKNVSFELKDGDKVGLIGHNGSGKSSLLKVLSGVYAPNEGSLDIQGQISSLIDINVGVQHNLSGYENIRIRGLIMGYDADTIERIIEDVTEFSELGNYLAMPVKTYSSGMQVRLAFAMSTAISPDILLIDEVIGAGDARFLQKAKERMARVIMNSNILLLASHSDDIIREFCNKAILLEHGEIKLCGTPDEVLSAYAKSYNEPAVAETAVEEEAVA